MTLLLGIDNGLTVTKAVIFDDTGRVLSMARRRVPQSMPRPRHVERDMADLWAQTAAAIAEAVCLCARPASDIACIAATAHGDGLYLLDRDARPLGPGILSLDSRAGAVAGGWDDDGTGEGAGSALIYANKTLIARIPGAGTSLSTSDISIVERSSSPLMSL